MSEQNNSTNNKRIVKNTIVLYFRMILIMAVNLYTSRIILTVLGVNDYGIYNVIGGFVAMFSIISSSLNAAISRFITYELGAGNIDKLKKIFSSSVTIQMFLAFVILLLVEIFGIWFIEYKMVIEQDRVYAAHWVLQFSVLTFCINLISVPYNAAIVAHEEMTAYAYISILESLLKLAICFLIVISPIDNLVFYSGLLFSVSLIIRVIYGIYCKRKFLECSFKFQFDKELLYKMFAFSGWNFIGAGSGVLRDQGVNILLNIFWGPVVNASRGLAMQVSSAVASFSNSIITAINPQITKSFASDNKDYCFSLVMQGARFSSYLFLAIALPILFETEPIMNLWLVDVPDYAVTFVRLTIIYIFIESISYTMVNLMLATGSIRNYQLIVGGAQLLNFPVSYFVLKAGLEPYWTFYVSIFIAIICLFLRLYMLRRMIEFPVRAFVKFVLINLIVVIIMSSIIPFILELSIQGYWIKFISVFVAAEVSLLLCIFYIGLSANERSLACIKVLNTIRKK